MPSCQVKETFEVMNHGITINRIVEKFWNHYNGGVGLCSEVFCRMLF